MRKESKLLVTIFLFFSVAGCSIKNSSFFGMSKAELEQHDVALRAKWEAEQSARQAQIPVPTPALDPNTQSEILCVRRGETPRALYARGVRKGKISSEWGYLSFFRFLEERGYLHKGRCGEYLYAGDCVKIPQLSPLPLPQ